MQDIEIQEDWKRLLKFLHSTVGKKPQDLKGVLFLIGVQEFGQGARPFSKEEKQDLMHIAICKVLSLGGYYELKGFDEQGWPHWELVTKLPSFDLLQQEELLKHFVCRYFREEVGVHL